MSSDYGYRFGNRFYSVQFMQDDFLPSDSPYGIEYLFYLEDSVGKKRANGEIEYVPEYLVLFDKFVQLAGEYGLHLRERKNFLEYYNEKMGVERNRHLF